MKNVLFTDIPRKIANEFFLSSLKSGGSLSQELLKILNLKEGHFFSITAKSTDVSKLDDLKSEEILHKYIKHANAMWHYMNIITSSEFEVKKDEFSFDDIKKPAANASHVILGAYDMEGYVCWEKNTLKSLGGVRIYPDRWEHK